MLCSTGNRDLCNRYQLNAAEESINLMICESDDADFEPYSSEFLSRLRHGFRWLSRSQIITKFNLNDRQVRELCVLNPVLFCSLHAICDARGQNPPFVGNYL